MSGMMSRGMSNGDIRILGKNRKIVRGFEPVRYKHQWHPHFAQAIQLLDAG
jgi:hypothetical protein